MIRLADETFLASFARRLDHFPGDDLQRPGFVVGQLANAARKPFRAFAIDRRIEHASRQVRAGRIGMLLVLFVQPQLAVSLERGFPGIADRGNLGLQFLDKSRYALVIAAGSSGLFCNAQVMYRIVFAPCFLISASSFLPYSNMDVSLQKAAWLWS